MEEKSLKVLSRSKNIKKVLRESKRSRK
jgi:methyltransferase